MPKGVPLDLIGQRFESWLVLRRAGVNSNAQVLWLCRCECGREREVLTSNLRAGRSRRCRSCSNSRAYSSRWKKEGER